MDNMGIVLKLKVKTILALDALTVIVDTVMPSILIPWIVLLVAEV